MNRSKQWLVIGLLSALAIGCGDDDNNTGDNTDSSVDSAVDATSDDAGKSDAAQDAEVDAVMDSAMEDGFSVQRLGMRYAQAWCKQQFQCTPLHGQAPQIRVMLKDEANCVARFFASGAATSKFDAYEANIMAEKVTFDQEKFDACINVIETNCGARDEQIFCEEAFTGMVAEGEACNAGAECGPGLICAGSSCPGACQPDNRRRPPAEVLGEQADAGERCGDNVNNTRVACAPGFFCSEGVCAAVSARGESCEDKACDTTSICHPDTDICAAPETVAPSSGACVDGWCNSADRVFCNDDSMCEAFAGDGSEGSDCSSTDIDAFVSCNVGLVCGENNKCQTFKAIGEACESSSECASAQCNREQKCEMECLFDTNR